MTNIYYIKYIKCEAHEVYKNRCYGKYMFNIIF